MKRTMRNWLRLAGASVAAILAVTGAMIAALTIERQRPHHATTATAPTPTTQVAATTA